MVFVFMAYNILLITSFVGLFSAQFIRDKYWKTIALVLIAPLNRICLLFGIVLSRLILIAIPWIFFFILCYIYYPISLLTVLFVILVYILLIVIFSSIGLLIGVFAISNENIMGILRFLLGWLFWFSCLTYPFQIFPAFIQVIINLNPFYHMFNFLRLTWIQNNILLSITSYFMVFLFLVISAILLPIISVFIFNKVFKKYGIVGY